ncbi:zinc finger CCCH domain-containing protein 3 isoform X1 [Salmo salar]|uniref:Zinc finger CCCH domain-containing protein 3 n=2 Tax=Salmo salar TaxID=8030 RepID=A0A1S3P9Y7_SALSA|nr:zinc finger CCCH domain-containing protein 3-like isoform X1 [Salmo salar]|eukprot:XP_014024369.1 PREDICTED: zinc finger CCCH domain-containing protein 3-like isoform X1 [Salmo salar]
MDEREALKRQIDLLQNLINNHRSIHGDAPSCSGQQWHPARPPARGRSPSSFFSSTFPSRGGPQPTGHWRKTYTLSSKTSAPQHSRPTTRTAKPSLEQQGRPIQITKPSLEQALDSASPNSSTGFLSLHVADTLQSSHSSKDPARGEKDGTKCSTSRDLTGTRGQQYALTGGVRRSMTGTGSGSTAIETELSRGRTEPGGKAGLGVLGLKGPGPPKDQHRETKHDIQAKTEGKSIGLGLPLMMTTPGQMDLSGFPTSAKTTTTATRVQSTAQLHIKHCVTGKANTAAKQVVAKATSNNNPTPSDVNSLPLPLPPPLSAPPSASLSPRSKLTPAQPASSPHNHSKFTWVKSHQPGGVRPSKVRTESRPPENQITPVTTTVSHSGVPSSFSSSLSSSRKAFAPRKKVPRRLSLSTAVPKTSKYTWVSSSAGAQARLSRKPLSPKDLLKEEGVAKKPKSQNLLAKQCKAAGASSSTTLSSRYRWKAGSGGGGQTGSGTGSRGGSLFRWTSEKENGSSVPPSVTQRTASSSPGGFKLRSRMKIIRRSVSSGSGAERRSSPAAMTLISRYSLRLRTHTPVRTHTAVRTRTLVQSPGGVKRTPSLELVSFGRHKLRRLSPNPSRTGPASLSLHSQSSQRVFRTRYKIVTRLGGATSHTPHYSHTLSWRAKRIHTARSVLQSRLRPPGQDRHPPAQHWRGRGRGMRWIGGNLYSVSANKLSRTVTTSAPINRTVRLSSPQEVSHTTSSSFIRPSSTRFVASRAVQRSLAIIRHARQKKSQKQYCMYYNRFGKCNRGNTCPYIHDPDKVAVCTRFLRGTCKQTGGTCPFSHKVAKEKMPVCSYFLKGICNNSSCPYSHVYVSRKAALCQDFIRGYCPQGEKCKKKHTLVCPDFSSSGSCPRGAQCKLQHRQRAKRTAPNPNPTTGPSAAPAKKARTKRPSLSVVLPDDQAAEGSAQADPGTPSSSSLGPHKTKLPSFISLSSSPEDTDAPDTPPADGAEVTERILQIKPRL